MKKYIIIFLVSIVPLCLKAQVESTSDSIDNGISTLVCQLSEKQHEIDVLNDSIKRLNDNISASFKTNKDQFERTNKQLALYQDTIAVYRNEKRELLSVIQEKNDSLKILASIDTIIYKQCLLFPLERRFNPKHIFRAKHCLQAMNIESTHAQNFKKYFHFLDDYESFNQEVIMFLKKQEESFSKKQWKSSAFEMVIPQANKALESLNYNQWYQKRNTTYESIPYLDETLDDFFSQLKSGKLNSTTMEELIQRLQPKQ